ncbi:brachyurin-like isoform X2 [Zophobas morio]|uniref:brachyurin-like isoform X2 n=1 Tax=Zophobas morio TaxID=2755281 RepID=UPI003082EE8C
MIKIRTEMLFQNANMITLVALIFCLSTTCTHADHVQSRPKGRIIGGDTANAGQFPYIASIYKSTNAGTYFCAGTLINNQWILTAGQCVIDGVLFNIRLGSNHLNDPNALRLATDQYFLHPDYNPDTLENDVGLIKFREAIQFTDYVKAINFLSSANLTASASVETAGWGQTSDEDAGLVDELNVVSLVTLSNEECRLTFGNQITDNMVCAGGNYNEGTCTGDIGGPLIQTLLGLQLHVGVASFISGRGCESTDPSGFTRTAPYVPWIRSILESTY